jgi:hypothetical protein
LLVLLLPVGWESSSGGAALPTALSGRWNQFGGRRGAHKLLLKETAGRTSNKERSRKRQQQQQTGPIEESMH